MYYRYTETSEIVDSIEMENDILCRIVLKGEMPFLLGKSYITIHKHYYDPQFSDRITVSYYSEIANLIDAKKYIKESIEFLTYLTGLPYETNNRILEEKYEVLPCVNINMSKLKMNKIININMSYNKIKKKKELLFQCMQIYASGVRLNFLQHEFVQGDAFFAFFKIIEIISKDEYKSEIKEKVFDKTSLKIFLEKEYLTQFGIETTQESLSEIVGVISKEIKELTFASIFHKILFFAYRRTIKVNPEKVQKIVNIRNQYAHGDSLDMSEDEYKYTLFLSREFINRKFFNISNIEIESKIIEL